MAGEISGGYHEIWACAAIKTRIFIKGRQPGKAKGDGDGAAEGRRQSRTRGDVVPDERGHDDEEHRLRFEGAAAEETGVVVDWALLRTREILTNESLRDRVKRWCAGDHEGLPHISTWNTSLVTDMSSLFMGQRNFNDNLTEFNEF